MGTMSLTDRLGFLEVLTGEEREKLHSRSRIVRVRRGQTLLSRGERSSEVFIVLEGRLRVLLYSTTAREVFLRELAEGDMFGELGAIDGEDRSVNIVASSEVRLISFAQSDFTAAMMSSARSVEWMMKRLIAQVRNLTDRVFALSALNVQTRLHCELLRIGKAAAAGGSREVCPAPTHSELANRVGTSREVVTREMSVLSGEYIIRSGRRRLEFLDLPRLEEYVARSSLRDLGN
jgi:CRP/FNR family transcriptional regulator, cyclic AMP receptor protein